MPNPISVPIAVTQANKVLYIAVDTYAAYMQQVSIQPPTGNPLVATGNGEGKRIGYWTYPITNTGIYTFSLLIQYNDGSGYKNSHSVQTGAVSVGTLNQTVVFSEDANDNDDNDCFVTLMWFSSAQ
jgi:hypothetical protein